MQYITLTRPWPKPRYNPSAEGSQTAARLIPNKVKEMKARKKAMNERIKCIRQ